MAIRVIRAGIGAGTPAGQNVRVEATAAAFRAEPVAGRVYTGRRIVRSADVTAGGRLRLDALAR